MSAKSGRLVGQVVKFTFVSPRRRRRASERLWVYCVEDPGDDYIVGRLASEPGEDLGVHVGDLLILSLDHAQEVERAPRDVARARGGPARGRPKAAHTIYAGP